MMLINFKIIPESKAERQAVDKTKEKPADRVNPRISILLLQMTVEFVEL